MNSFSEMDFSKEKRRALMIALLSTIPGLGQLFNGRRDKALAFFAVNLANAVFVAVLYACRVPFIDHGYRYLQFFSYAWAPGTVQFTVLQAMLFSYILYAQYDAYKDALSASAARPASNGNPGLSETTCASYIVHLSAFLLVGLLVVLRICPDLCPREDNQICLSFELQSPQFDEQKSEGNKGKAGEESQIDDTAHLKEPIRDAVRASSASAELNANEQESVDDKAAAEETEVVASKQIIAPFSKQSPNEMSSNGAAENARKTTKTPVEETKASSSTPGNIVFAGEQAEYASSPNQQENSPDPIKQNRDRLLEAAKKIAQAMPVAVASAGITRRIYDSSAQAGKSLSSAGSNSFASAGTDNAGGPSMLGFMDSTLSADPSMRLLWSEMSGKISKAIKANPLKGEGTAIVNFTVDNRGRISSLEGAAWQNELDQSLVETLQNMEKTVAPAKQFSKLFFQVKASNLKTGTVVALEINSVPTPVTPESTSEFKYQVSLQTYLKGIKKAIYSSWRPPVQEGVKPVMIGFKVSTEGTVSEQSIVESSGDPKMDRAALNAALSITNWSQPPAGTAEDLDVCMVLQKCKNCDAELHANEQSTNKISVDRAVDIEPGDEAAARPLLLAR